MGDDIKMHVLALLLKNGQEIKLNVPVKGRILSKDNPDDVTEADAFSNEYQAALRKHALMVFDIGVRTLEAMIRSVHKALGYTRIEDWAWDRFHVRRRTIFYYKYAGAVYYRAMEVMPDIFKYAISHTKLILVGDKILSSKDPEQIKEYVHDTISLSSTQLQQKYHGKKTDELQKFWGIATLKNYRAQYQDMTIHLIDTSYDISSDAFFTTWHPKKFRFYMEEIK